MDEAGARTVAAIPQAPPPPSSERERLIATLVDGREPRHFVPFRGGFLKAPEIDVPQEMLLYRVENGRLIAELEEHARAQGQDLTRLASGQETLPVQRLLHGFLVAKASDPRGPILQELGRLAQQTEPLLITADGVMVNGNRRLAAMRELHARDPVRYAGFAHIRAAVLPADAAVADVESLEAALQLAPETKLGYGWINRRLKMRRQLGEMGLPLQAMRDAYRIDDADQFDRELDELALAEAYLADFLGDPGRYSRLADAELLFVGLRQRLAVLKDPLRRVWRLAGFAMIHGRAAVEGPMDRQFPFAEPTPGQLPVLALRRFAEARELLAEGTDASDNEPLPGDVMEGLGVIFADPDRSRTVAPELYAAMEGVRAELQEQGSPQRLLKLLEKLRQSMGQVRPDRLSERQRLFLKSEIAALQAQAAVLLDEKAASGAPRSAAGLGDRLSRLIKGG